VRSGQYTRRLRHHLEGPWYAGEMGKEESHEVKQEGQSSIPGEEQPQAPVNAGDSLA